MLNRETSPRGGVKRDKNKTRRQDTKAAETPPLRFVSVFTAGSSPKSWKQDLVYSLCSNHSNRMATPYFFFLDVFLGFVFVFFFSLLTSLAENLGIQSESAKLVTSRSNSFISLSLFEISFFTKV